MMENRKKKKRENKTIVDQTWIYGKKRISLQLGSSNCNQHALSKLSHQLYQLKCQHFRVVVALLDVISWRQPYYVKPSTSEASKHALFTLETTTEHIVLVVKPPPPKKKKNNKKK